MTQTSYPALAHFVGAWLHQDWVLDYETVWDALEAFRVEEPSCVDQLRDDVGRLVSAGLSDAELEELVGDRLGCEYWPPGDGLTFSSWLAEVDVRLSRR